MSVVVTSPDCIESPLYLGVDGGGTKCVAILAGADGQILGHGISGPANPYQDLEQSRVSIALAAELAIKAAGLDRRSFDRIIAGVGLAGVNLPAVFEKMARWDHPFKTMYLTTDLEIACLGAHAGKDGAIMISGTGSSGCSIVNGRSIILGAYGYPFADKCSGAWIGLEAIRAALRAEDDLGPDTILRAMINEALQAKGNAVVEKLIDARPNDLAAFANQVFDAADQNDEVAICILKEGAAYLDTLAQRLLDTGPPALAFLGGLSRALLPWLDRSIVSQLSTPKMQANRGALFFAKRESASSTTLQNDVG